MTLSIIGEEAKKAFVPASLFTLSKELAIALEEWSGTPSISLDSIRSLDDVEIERQKLCTHIAYAMFRTMAEKELWLEEDRLSVKNSNSPIQNSLSWWASTNRYLIFASFHWHDCRFLSYCDEASISYLNCMYEFFEKMREEEMDFSPLPKELTPQVDNIDSATSKIVCESCGHGYEIATMAKQMKMRFGIDPYAFLSTLFMRFDVNDVLDSDMQESGLNIEKLTWRILTQAAKETKTQNLKDFFTELFPFFTHEDMSYISGLIAPHASDEELLKAPLELDDEYRDELEIEAVFKSAYNLTQELEDSLHKFESQILIKSKAFEDCSAEEQDFIESLKARSTALLALFPTLEEIARSIPTAKSQRAQKRLCMQAIHAIQDSLSLGGSDSSAKEAQDSHKDSPKDS